MSDTVQDRAQQQIHDQAQMLKETASAVAELVVEKAVDGLHSLSANAQNLTASAHEAASTALSSAHDTASATAASAHSGVSDASSSIAGSVSDAVADAIDEANRRARRARKQARKASKKASKQAHKKVDRATKRAYAQADKAYAAAALAVGHKPKSRKKLVWLIVGLLAGAAVAGAVAQRARRSCGAPQDSADEDVLVSGKHAPSGSTNGYSATESATTAR